MTVEPQRPILVSLQKIPTLSPISGHNIRLWLSDRHYSGTVNSYIITKCWSIPNSKPPLKKGHFFVRRTKIKQTVQPLLSTVSERNKNFSDIHRIWKL